MIDEHLPGVVATIGAFDGVHRGHQVLLSQVVARASALSCASLAVTFDPHPDLVLYPDRRLTELSDPQQKRDLMCALGISFVKVFAFTRELSMLRPEEFVGEVLTEYRLRELWVGSDFALGRGRSGTIAALAELGGNGDFALHVVPPVKIGREVVSSTYIRTLLAQGDVRRANDLLGHRYALAGTVVHGAGRGRAIDVPTANLQVRSTRTIPADGVYAAMVPIENELRTAVVNVGGRPTFGEAERLIEAHLLAYDGDLYDRKLTVEFVARLRDVKKFDSIGDLRDQIARDIAAVRILPEVVAAAGLEGHTT